MTFCCFHDMCFDFMLTAMYLGFFTENLLTFCAFPFQIFPRDLSCMATMITFEYLIQLCQNKEQVCPLSSARDAPGTKVHRHPSPYTQSYEIRCSVWCFTPVGEIPTAAADDCIHTVPFQFNLMKLLPKCQQIELFFYTFSRGTNRSSIHPNPHPVMLYIHIPLSKSVNAGSYFTVDLWPLTEAQADASRSASSLPNDILLSLFHSSLQNELSDREISLTDGDHVTFMHHILERERDGHVAPFSLPVIKGDSALFLGLKCL